MITRLRLLAFFICLSFLPAGTAGAKDTHWKAQIVDADTMQPLEGVVVLAVWNERYGSVGGWAGGGYFDSQEVVTGSDGIFLIRAPRKSFNPFSVIKGPEFYIFKAGFGRWRFQGEESWLALWWEERDKKYEEAWAKFTGDGVVLKLPPLKTRQERLKFIAFVPGPMPDVPRDRMRRYLEAVDQERVMLGLDPPRSNSVEPR